MEPKKAPRLYHRKSKTGCQRCRARRVKCDEMRPACSSCARHKVACTYDVLPSADKEPASKATTQNGLLLEEFSSSIPSLNVQDICPIPGLLPDSLTSLPESEARRMLELHLLQHYINHTSQSFPGAHNPSIRHAWAVIVPDLAIQHPNLLYSVFTIAAHHLIKTSTPTPELTTAQHNYQFLAFQEQRKAVADLNADNADAICFTSVMILRDAFANLQDRPLEPWEPPTDWLQMSRGAGSVFRAAFRCVHDPENSKVMVFVNKDTVIDDGHTLFEDENRKGMEGLLLGQDQDEMLDDVTKEAYERTLNFLGSVQIAIMDDEHIYAICRRLMAFALMVPKRFIEFIEEKRPRALVILAHYFALAAKIDGIWWVGDTGRREVQGIMKALPPEWHDQMRWPLEMTGLEIAVKEVVERDTHVSRLCNKKSRMRSKS